MVEVEDSNIKSKISVDERFLLASAVYKMCRIGDVENALKFGEKLRRGVGDFYTMRILTQLCGEDLSPSAYCQIVPTIRTIYEAAKNKDCRGHDLWCCIYLVASAEKWYMSQQGIELEKIRHMVNKNNPEIQVPNPAWLYDYHVHEGRKRIAAGTADLSLDGRWEFRFAILKRWQKILEENKGDVAKARIAWVKSYYTNGGEENGENNKGTTKSGA